MADHKVVIEEVPEGETIDIPDTARCIETEPTMVSVQKESPRGDTYSGTTRGVRITYLDKIPETIR